MQCGLELPSAIYLYCSVTFEVMFQCYCDYRLCAVNTEHGATFGVIYTEPYSGCHSAIRPGLRHRHVSDWSVIWGSYRLCRDGHDPRRPARGQLHCTAEYHLTVCMSNHRRAKPAIRRTDLCRWLRRWKKYISWCTSSDAVIFYLNSSTVTFRQTQLSRNLVTHEVPSWRGAISCPIPLPCLQFLVAKLPSTEAVLAQCAFPVFSKLMNILEVQTGKQLVSLCINFELCKIQQFSSRA